MSERLPLTAKADYVAYGTFLRSLEDLKATAIGEIFIQGYSYRGFYVGASFLVLTADNETVVFSGANLKRSGKEKVCAEKRALGRLDKANVARGEAGVTVLKCAAILGAVVVGSDNPQEIFDVTGLHAYTLYPCGDMCVPMLGDKEIDQRALFITTGRNGHVYEAHSLNELEETYRHPAPSLADVPAYDSRCWNDATDLYAKTVAAQLERGVDERIAAPILALQALRAEQFRLGL